MVKKSVIYVLMGLFLVLAVMPVWAETAEEWKVKGNGYIENKEYDKALECYEKSLEVDPNYARSIHNIGMIYNRKQEYTKALEVLDKALTLVQNGEDTSNLEVIIHYTFTEMGIALNGQKKYGEALGIFDIALSSAPDYPLAWFGKGYASFYEGRYEEAVECCDKYISLVPDDFTGWLSKGMALYNLKKYQDAIECFDKVLAIEPDIKQALEYKEKALAALKSNSTSYSDNSSNSVSDNSQVSSDNNLWFVRKESPYGSNHYLRVYEVGEDNKVEKSKLFDYRLYGSFYIDSRQKIFIYPSDDNDLYYVNGNLDNIKRLTFDGNNKYPEYLANLYPTLSPDGKKLAYIKTGIRDSRSFFGDLYYYDLSTGKEKCIKKFATGSGYEKYSINSPVWMDNDSLLVSYGYLSGDTAAGGKPDLYLPRLVKLDGTISSFINESNIDSFYSFPSPPLKDGKILMKKYNYKARKVSLVMLKANDFSFVKEFSGIADYYWGEDKLYFLYNNDGTLYVTINDLSGNQLEKYILYENMTTWSYGFINVLEYQDYVYIQPFDWGNNLFKCDLKNKKCENIYFDEPGHSDGER